jgi:hypothetical protein
MRRTTIFMATALALTGVASAKMGELVASLALQPRRDTNYGLAVDASYLYNLNYVGSVPTIYVLVKSSGSIVNSYPPPFWNPMLTRSVFGLSYEGGGYLHVSDSAGRVSKIRASDGSLISTWFYVPEASGKLCVVGNKEIPNTTKAFYVSSRQITLLYAVYLYTTNGSVVTRFFPRYQEMFELTWDYVNGYIWYGQPLDNIYPLCWIVAITPENDVVYRWQLPPGVTVPSAIAYYSQYLYVGTTGGEPDEYVWVYHCPKAYPNVEPASVGRVKAIFR